MATPGPSRRRSRELAAAITGTRCDHCWPFPHALINAVKVMTFGTTVLSRVSSKEAGRQLPLPVLLISSLKVITSRASLLSRNSSVKPSAQRGWPSMTL